MIWLEIWLNSFAFFSRHCVLPKKLRQFTLQQLAQRGVLSFTGYRHPVLGAALGH
jgi:hypothetical protein